MTEQQILQSYSIAKERYAAIGVDTDKAIATLEQTPISLHCWQADDVMGFESNAGLSGGIQTTGNYPGRARNIDEVRSDLEFVNSLLAGVQRVNLHEIYGDFQGRFVDRDKVDASFFQSWIDWARSIGVSLDFNSTSFGHPKSGNLSLANPDPEIRPEVVAEAMKGRRGFRKEHRKPRLFCTRRVSERSGTAPSPVLTFFLNINSEESPFLEESGRNRSFFLRSRRGLFSVSCNSFCTEH